MSVNARRRGGAVRREEIVVEEARFVEDALEVGGGAAVESEAFVINGFGGGVGLDGGEDSFDGAARDSVRDVGEVIDKDADHRVVVFAEAEKGGGGFGADLWFGDIKELVEGGK